MDPITKREIIMENYQNPMNKETPADGKYIKVNSNNPSCIDNINLYIFFEENKIKDLKFDGEACAISTSSTSIMISNLVGKSIKEALEFVMNFENMIYEREYNPNLLNDALAYEDIYKQQNRINCAILPYRGLKDLLEEQLKAK